MEFTTNSGTLGAEIWRKQLQQISTSFGRLVFLASLRDARTGMYTHPALADVLGREGADRTLRHSHQQAFSNWIGSTLEQQKADLDEYLRESCEREVSRMYRNLIPQSARDVERQLYLTDLEMLLALIRLEVGSGAAAPGASLRR